MHGRRIVGLGLTWLTALSVSAAGPDEDYVRIYRTIMEADAMKENGQPKEAAKLYDNAKEALHQLRSLTRLGTSDSLSSASITSQAN